MMPADDLNKLDKELLEVGAGLSKFRDILRVFGSESKNASGKLKDSSKDLINGWLMEEQIKTRMAEFQVRFGAIINNSIRDEEKRADTMRKLNSVMPSFMGALKDHLREVAVGNERLEKAKSVFGKFNEIISAFGLRLPMTIGAITSAILALESVAISGKKREFAIASPGVYGIGREDARKATGQYTGLLRMFKSDEEIEKIYSNLSKQGMSAGFAFDELGKRAIFSQAATVKGVNESTADNFYRLVSLRMQKKPEEGVKALGYLSGVAEITGVSMETYTQILNELMSSSGALGSKFDDLVAITARYGIDVRDGRVALGDFNKLLSSTKEASAGRQIGTIEMAKHLGVSIPKDIAKIPPLEIPLAIASGKIGGDVLRKIEFDIIDKFAPQIKESSGMTYESSRLMAATKFLNMSPTAAYAFLTSGPGGSAELPKAGKSVAGGMGRISPTQEFMDAMSAVKETLSLTEKTSLVFKDAVDSVVSSFDKPIQQNITFEADPVRVPVTFFVEGKSGFGEYTTIDEYRREHPIKEVGDLTEIILRGKIYRK